MLPWGTIAPSSRSRATQPLPLAAANLGMEFKGGIPVSEPSSPGLSERDLARLDSLLCNLPPQLQPPDICALDGYLCGVLLQPRPVPPALWLPWVSDVEGRPAAPGTELQELHGLVLRRHAELERAIAQRDWFDPWVYQLDDATDPSECMLPWVAGFAAAMETFPGLMNMSDPELVEPLALLFMHFAAEDLEDADALLAVIETLDPPSDLAEAVQDTVRALMLIADVSRPRAVPPRAGRAASGARRPGSRHTRR